jgi:uncharacterized protein YciI
MLQLRILHALPILLLLGACWSGSKRKESSPAEPASVTEPTAQEVPMPFDTVETGDESALTDSTTAFADDRADPTALGAGTETSNQADYVFVYLRAGLESAHENGIDPETLQVRHIANIQKLAEEHSLLVAGPFREGSPDPDLRGLFVLDVADVERAKDILQTDPAVASGALVPIVLRWRATKSLRQVLELDLEERARRQAENPNGTPPFDMHHYMLGDARAAAGAENALMGLREEGRLLFFGRVQDDLTGRAIFLLDAENEREAREMLEPAKISLSNVALHPWLGSTRLTKLAELDAQ